MKTITYMPGVWDLFHVGHANALRRASLFGDYLIVGVCSDELCKYHKGKYPAINQYDRGDLLQQVKGVNEVYLYESLDQTHQLKMLKPHVFAIGEEFGRQQVPEHETAIQFCKDNNIEIKRILRLKNVSTTQIKSNIK